jgi:hypothetical protein
VWSGQSSHQGANRIVVHGCHRSRQPAFRASALKLGRRRPARIGTTALKVATTSTLPR